MKKNLKSFAAVLLLLAGHVVLFSFTSPRGGDSFTIHLNNKLVLHQYLHVDKAVKTLSLQAANNNDKLRISFSHCGQVGKSRSITIKDGQNKVLKQWRYADNHSSMVCKVKDITGLKKGNGPLQLFYSSGEMPAGRVLASVIVEGNSIAKKLNQ
jgi:hypothetical protein